MEMLRGCPRSKNLHADYADYANYWNKSLLNQWKFAVIRGLLFFLENPSDSATFCGCWFCCASHFSGWQKVSYLNLFYYSIQLTILENF